jgi:hypothetical protein
LVHWLTWISRGLRVENVAHHREMSDESADVKRNQIPVWRGMGLSFEGVGNSPIFNGVRL